MATSEEWRRWAATHLGQGMITTDMENKLTEVQNKLQSDEKENLEIAHCVHIDIDALDLACTIARRCFKALLSSDGGNDDNSKVVFFHKKVVELLENSCMRVRHDLEKNVEEDHLDKLEYLLYRSHVELNEIKKEKDPLKHYWFPYVEAEYGSLRDTWDMIIRKWKLLAMLPERSKRLSEEIFEMGQTRLGLVSCLQVLEATGSPSVIFEVAQKIGALSTGLIQATHENSEQLVTVSPRIILEVASSMTGVPSSWLDNSWEPPLQGLRERLLKGVIGQKNAINAITNALLRPRPNDCSWPCPIGSFLFLCDFGFGGMELVEALAEHIFDRKDQVLRFNVSNDSFLHSSPCSSCSDGIHHSLCRDCNHKEHGVGGKLVEAVKSKPYCVLLFDNVDKADSFVTDILIDILKHGKLIDLQGGIVDFSKTLIVMTSDVGKNVIRQSFCKCLEKDRDFPLKKEIYRDFYPFMENTCNLLRVLREASKFLKQELIDQLDDIIVLSALRFQEFNSVARLQLRHIPEIMKQKGLILYPSEAALRSITRKSLKKIDAGLHVMAWLQEKMVPSLVELVAENETNDICAIYIDVLMGTDKFDYRFKRGGPVDDKDFKQCKESIHKLRVIYRKEKERVNKIYLFRLKYYELKSMIREKTMEDIVYVDQVVQEFVNLLDFLRQNALDVRFAREEYILELPKSLSEAEVRQGESSDMREATNKKARIDAALPDRLGLEGEAIDVIANALLRCREEQNQTHQPARSFLFLGLTSVGKADLVRRVVEHFATYCTVIPINLQEFSDPDSFVGLIHGTVGLPSVSTVRPYLVLLINDVEKASVSVFNALISVLDNGMLGDSEGIKMVDFSKTVVVMTSELGNKEILARLVGDTPPGPEEESEEKPGKRLFRTELLNRVDEIVLFNPSAREQLRKVARLSMEAGPHLEERSFSGFYWSFFTLFNESTNDLFPRSPDSIEYAVSYFSTGLIGAH